MFNWSEIKKNHLLCELKMKYFHKAAWKYHSYSILYFPSLLIPFHLVLAVSLVNIIKSKKVKLCESERVRESKDTFNLHHVGAVIEGTSFLPSKNSLLSSNQKLSLSKRD